MACFQYFSAHIDDRTGVLNKQKWVYLQTKAGTKADKNGDKRQHLRCYKPTKSVNHKCRSNNL